MTLLPSTYRAVVYERFGKMAETLKIKDVPLEPLLANDVRIRVKSAALNPIDRLVAEEIGEMYTGGTPSADKPYRVGWDVAGTVVELGPSAEGLFEIGDAVYAMTPPTRVGTLAEFVAVDAQIVALKPKTLDFDHAAAAALVALTSYQGILDIVKLQPGERILVVGGSTSVGMVAIQLARMIGAYVIATASTSKMAFVTSLGADEVIDYTTTTWRDAVEEHSLDVFYDCSVDPSAWERDAQLVLKKEGSRFATLHPRLEASPAKFGATRLDVWCVPSGKQLTEIAALIDDGKLKVVVDSVFPFEKTVDAFALLNKGRVVGKVVVQIQE